MGQSSMKASGDKEYLTSDRWKCDKSPSGAHYWIIHSYEMTCKFCSEIKPVNATGFGWPKPDAKKTASKQTESGLFPQSQPS
jgi:hypothetical protein